MIHPLIQTSSFHLAKKRTKKTSKIRNMASSSKKASVSTGVEQDDLTIPVCLSIYMEGSIQSKIVIITTTGNRLLSIPPWRRNGTIQHRNRHPTRLSHQRIPVSVQLGHRPVHHRQRLLAFCPFLRAPNRAKGFVGMGPPRIQSRICRIWSRKSYAVVRPRGNSASEVDKPRLQGNHGNRARERPRHAEPVAQ